MIDLIPLSKRGDVSFRVSGHDITLRLTPTACALIEEKTARNPTWMR